MKNLYYKTIREFLDYIVSISNSNFIFIDTETTGLRGSKIEQLTQISAIKTEFDYDNNTIKELDFYDKKIKLTTKTLERISEQEKIEMKWKIKDVLELNHYYKDNNKCYDEKRTLTDFHKWSHQNIKDVKVMQHSKFDLDMLNGRHKHNFDGNILDTKIIIQLFFIPSIQKLAEKSSKYRNMLDEIGTSDRDNGLISSSMSKVGPALGLDMNMYHNSLSDCRITINMFLRIMEFLKNNLNLDIKKYQEERISRKKVYS